jgi:hypothetical protein
MKMNEIGDACPIAISLINLVPEDFDTPKPGTTAGSKRVASTAGQTIQELYRNLQSKFNIPSRNKTGKHRFVALHSRSKQGAASLHSRRCGCLLARMEKPKWSIIPGILPGTS